MTTLKRVYVGARIKSSLFGAAEAVYVAILKVCAARCVSVCRARAQATARRRCRCSGARGRSSACTRVSSPRCSSGPRARPGDRPRTDLEYRSTRRQTRSGNELWTGSPPSGLKVRVTPYEQWYLQCIAVCGDSRTILNSTQDVVGRTSCSGGVSRLLLHGRRHSTPPPPSPPQVRGRRLRFGRP